MVVMVVVVDAMVLEDGLFLLLLFFALYDFCSTLHSFVIVRLDDI